jgi:hypothetical protein
MFSWEWEDFEEIVRKYGPVVEDAGPLSTPVQHFTIHRDESLHLKMLTHAPVSARDSAVSYPSGTVRENTDTIDRLIALKELPVRRLGRRVVIPRNGLQNLLRADHPTQAA